MDDSTSSVRNDGTGTVNDAHASAGGDLQFPNGINPQKLWLEQMGSDLLIFQIGTTNTVTESGFFDPNARHGVEGLVTSSGLTLNSQLGQLVNAMATYSANNPGFDPTQATQMPDDRVLQGAITAAWMPSGGSRS